MRAEMHVSTELQLQTEGFPTPAIMQVNGVLKTSHHQFSQVTLEAFAIMPPRHKGTHQWLLAPKFLGYDVAPLKKNLA